MDAFDDELSVAARQYDERRRALPSRFYADLADEDDVQVEDGRRIRKLFADDVSDDSDNEDRLFERLRGIYGNEMIDNQPEEESEINEDSVDQSQDTQGRNDEQEDEPVYQSALARRIEALFSESSDEDADQELDKADLMDVGPDMPPPSPAMPVPASEAAGSGTPPAQAVTPITLLKPNDKKQDEPEVPVENIDTTQELSPRRLQTIMTNLQKLMEGGAAMDVDPVGSSDNGSAPDVTAEPSVKPTSKDVPFHRTLKTRHKNKMVQAEKKEPEPDKTPTTALPLAALKRAPVPAFPANKKSAEDQFQSVSNQPRPSERPSSPNSFNAIELTPTIGSPSVNLLEVGPSTGPVQASDSPGLIEFPQEESPPVQERRPVTYVLTPSQSIGQGTLENDLRNMLQPEVEQSQMASASSDDDVFKQNSVFFAEPADTRKSQQESQTPGTNEAGVSSSTEQPRPVQLGTKKPRQNTKTTESLSQTPFFPEPGTSGAAGNGTNSGGIQPIQLVSTDKLVPAPANSTRPFPSTPSTPSTTPIRQASQVPQARKLGPVEPARGPPADIDQTQSSESDSVLSLDPPRVIGRQSNPTPKPPVERSTSFYEPNVSQSQSSRPRPRPDTEESSIGNQSPSQPSLWSISNPKPQVTVKDEPSSDQDEPFQPAVTRSNAKTPSPFRLPGAGTRVTGGGGGTPTNASGLYSSLVAQQQQQQSLSAEQALRLVTDPAQRLLLCDEVTQEARNRIAKLEEERRKLQAENLALVVRQYDGEVDARRSAGASTRDTAYLEKELQRYREQFNKLVADEAQKRVDRERDQLRKTIEDQKDKLAKLEVENSKLEAENSRRGLDDLERAKQLFAAERDKLIKDLQKKETELAELRIGQQLSDGKVDIAGFTKRAFDERVEKEVKTRVESERAKLETEKAKLEAEKAKYRLDAANKVKELQNQLAEAREAPGTSQEQLARQLKTLQEAYDQLKKDIEKAINVGIEQERAGLKNQLAKETAAAAAARTELAQLKSSDQALALANAQKEAALHKAAAELAKKELDQLAAKRKTDLEETWQAERSKLTDAIAKLRVRLSDAETRNSDEGAALQQKKLELAQEREKQAREELDLVKKGYKQEFDAKWAVEKAGYEKKLAGLAEELGKLRAEQRTGPGSTLEATEQQVKALRRENDALKRQVELEKAEGERTATERMRKELDKARAENASLREKIAKTRDEDDTYRLLDVSAKENEILKREKDMLQKQLETCKEVTRRECEQKWSADKSRLNERIRNLEEQVRSQDVLELSDRLDRADLENARLKRELELAKRLAGTEAASSQLEQQKKIVDRNARLLEENVKLSQSELREQIAQRDLALDNAKAEKQRLEQEVKTLTARLKAIRESHDALERGSIDGSGDVAQGYAELLDSQRQQTQYWKDRASYASVLTAEIERLKREKRGVEDCEVKLRQAELKLFEREQELAVAKADATEGLQAAKLSNLKIKETYADDVMNLKKKLQELTSKLLDYEYGVTLPEDAETIKKLRREKEKCEQECELAKHENALLKGDAKRVKEEIARLKEEITRLRAELKASNADKLRKQIRKLQEDYDKLEEALRDSKERELEIASVLGNLSGKSPSDIQSLLSSAFDKRGRKSGSNGPFGTSKPESVTMGFGSSGSSSSSPSSGSGLDLLLPSDRMRVELGPGASSNLSTRKAEDFLQIFQKLQRGLWNSPDFPGGGAQTYVLAHLQVIQVFVARLFESPETVVRIAADASQFYNICLQVTLGSDSKEAITKASVDQSTANKNFSAYSRDVLQKAALQLQAAGAELNKYVVTREQQRSSRILFANGGTQLDDPFNRLGEEFTLLKTRFIVRAVDTVLALACFQLLGQPENVRKLFMKFGSISIEGRRSGTGAFESVAAIRRSNESSLPYLIMETQKSLRLDGLVVFGLPAQRVPDLSPEAPGTKRIAPPFWKLINNTMRDVKYIELKNVSAALRDFYAKPPPSENIQSTERYNRAASVNATLLSIFLTLYTACDKVTALSSDYKPESTTLATLCASCVSFRTAFVDCLIGLLLCRDKIRERETDRGEAARIDADEFMKDLDMAQYFSLGTAASQVEPSLPRNWRGRDI